MRPLLLACAAAALLAAAEPAAAQGSRRDREEPELVLDTGGRTGTCDDLQFTPDGKLLLAVGDDKVVHTWECAGGKLDERSMRALRWGVWREQRGSIYALAVSRDGKRIVIGGLGPKTATVAVLSLPDGDLVDTIVPAFEPGTNPTIRAAAFAPSGKRVALGASDGSVWVWDFKDNPKDDVRPPRQLGKHDAKGEKHNFVRLLHFLGDSDDRLLSVAELDGDVLEWDGSAKKPGKPKVMTTLEAEKGLFRVEISPDEKQLAVAPNRPEILLCPLAGGEPVRIKLDKRDNEYARSLAFDPKGKRLAVAVGAIVEKSRFHVEADDRISLFDLGASPPKEAHGPKQRFRADRLTFHPDGNLLAVAGGDDHEVTLWDLADLDKPASVMAGKGTCLWGVALSADGKQLGFRDQRDAASIDPNARAAGPWRVFGLGVRKWLPADRFKPAEQLDHIDGADGWRVEPDDKNAYVWYAVHASDNKRFKIPLDQRTDGMPLCYTFIESEGRPLRLAVGHDTGLSICEVTPKGVKRTALCVGHQGEVTALAVSADRSWLVSASRDQTVAAWSLSKEWPSWPILGAAFERAGRGLAVTAVDVGSPAWEAGLVAKDKIVAFNFAGEGWDKDHPADWLEHLRNPAPGKELLFEVQRGDDPKTFWLLTTVKQRPLWRFFPTRDNGWVLSMWLYPYYDCSAAGDYVAGWHVNNATDPLGAPTYYRLEKFRDVFRRRDVIDKLLTFRDPTAAALARKNPQPVRFSDLEPAAAELKLAQAKDGDDVEATLMATARGEDPDYLPARAEVWVNGCCLERMTDVTKKGGAWTKDGTTYRRPFTIPYQKLRAGKNVVTLLVYNGAGARADDSKELRCERKPPEKPRLFVVAVGIDNYGAAKDATGRGVLDNLNGAGNDAKSMAEAWAAQTLYDKPTVVRLPDKEAKRDADHDSILAALDRLAKDAGPDDRCVVFLAGHGYGVKRDAPGGAKHIEFVFCCPAYSPAAPEKEGISAQTLYEKLSALPCRTLVLIDACHSGAAAEADHPARALSPGGQGPIVLSACDVDQTSIEDADAGHGLFTQAVLDALGTHFAEAAQGREELFPDQLYHYVHERLPELLARLHQDEREQVPTWFAPEGEAYPVARRK
jgi:WD40 repeat protein